MNNHLNKFLLNNFLVVLVIGIIGAVLFGTLLSAYYHFSYPIILILSGSINVLVYYLLTRGKMPASKITVLIGQSFAIKFIYYLSVAAVFIYLIDNQSLKITFVILLFIFYFVFTLLEIRALLRFIKTITNNS